MLSKWDETTSTIEDVRPLVEARLASARSSLTTSAKTGRGIARLLDRIGSLYDKHAARISQRRSSTAFSRELREDRAAAVAARQAAQPPLRHADERPAAALPVLRQRSGLVTRDYAYWVENRMRERFALEGVPVSIDFVRRS